LATGCDYANAGFRSRESQPVSEMWVKGSPRRGGWGYIQSHPVMGGSYKLIVNSLCFMIELV